MKKTFALLIAGLLACAVTALAETDTQKEVRDVIIKASAYSNENLTAMPDSISKDGALEFWSSGGLLNEIPPNEDAGTNVAQSLTPKHITVIPLVEGQAAVAMYYSEGRLHPGGAELVSHYLTRVTEVYVKEDGVWKVRAAPWSALKGGSGTSQTSLD